jgi:DNA-binding transcriptional MerR regulator
MRDYFSTGAVAQQAGVSPSTIIYWERRGIVPKAGRVHYGKHRHDRIYSADDVELIVQLAKSRNNQAETLRGAA